MDIFCDILDPSKYRNAESQEFVQDIIDCNTADCDEQLLPLDSIADYLDSIVSQTKKLFREELFFDPFITTIALDLSKSTIKFPLPSSEHQMYAWQIQCKSLAFFAASQLVFVSSVCYHDDGRVIVQDYPPPDADMGLYTIGNSLNGNKLGTVIGINMNGDTVTFDEIQRNIVRDESFLADRASLYDIADPMEFEEMILTLPDMNIDTAQAATNCKMIMSLLY